jgi:hypothetical protein
LGRGGSQPRKRSTRVGHLPPANRVAELFRLKAKARPERPTPNRAYKVLQVLNIHDHSPQHNVAWKILPALLVPETGTALHTLIAPAGVKTLANVDMRTGDGLTRHARRLAVSGHDICQVFVHADICEPDGELPGPADFHAPTLLWALENSQQIALWCERGVSRHGDVAAWIVNAAYAGARFQTSINATPDNAAAWLAYVDRWRAHDAEVRVFGPGAPQ